MFVLSSYWGGEQAAWWGPVAVAVIAGLAFATVLTLVLVPVLYSLLDDAGAGLRKLYAHDDDAGTGGVGHAIATDGPV